MIRLGNSQLDRESWEKAFKLYVQAFQAPLKESDRNKLARLLKKPVLKDVLDWFFNYEAFLWGLGRMNLSKSCILLRGNLS